MGRGDAFSWKDTVEIEEASIWVEVEALEAEFGVEFSVEDLEAIIDLGITRLNEPRWIRLGFERWQALRS